MKATQADPLLRDIHLLFRAGATGGLTDGELLERFASRRDEAAFEVLVHRLGPMVLGVCRRMLRDRHDAEDAFQATFLVLARRASAIDPPERVGPWLYGVARQVAMRARASRTRRRLREITAPSLPEWPSDSDPDGGDLLGLLDGELGRLPEKYRAPIVLCHLEGKPYKEAARQLGLPEGTLSGRLTRGRALLAARLTRRGAALSAASLAVLLTKEASARVPMSLAASAAGAAAGLRGASLPAGIVSAEVAALAKGTLRTMLMTKIRVAALALATVGMVGVGVAAGGRDGPKPSEPAPAAREAKPVIPQLLRWPGGDIDISRITYERNGDDARKHGPDGGVIAVQGPGRLTDAGPMQRVEAYKIGDDLFINVAPDGSGRVLLEKVTNNRAQSVPDIQTWKFVWPQLPEIKNSGAGVQSDVAAKPDRDAKPETAAQPTPAGEATAAKLLYRSLVPGAEGPDDATFIRRAYLDVLGRVPTPEETAAYVRDDSPEKRAKLVERLLDDPAFLKRTKDSIKARLAPRKPVVKPFRFKIEGATLDRVDIDNGDLIDVRLDNGGDYPPTDRASAHPIYGLRNGELVTTIIPPATRIQAIPVAVDATIEIESEGGTITTGVGEAMLKTLKHGMRLSLDLSAEGPCLFVKGIKATTAKSSDNTSARIPWPKATTNSSIQAAENSVDDPPEPPPGVVGDLDHLGVVDRLAGDARGGVRHHREAEHLHPRMTGDDRLGDRRHPDDVGAERPEHPDLGRRLVARAGQSHVDARLQRDAERFGDLAGEGLQPIRVDLGHVGEPLAEAVVVRTSEGIRAETVDVVRQADEVALPIVEVDPAGRGREDQGRDTQPGEDAGREGDGRQVVPLVEVDPTLEHDDGRPPEPAGDEVAGVALDHRAGEVEDGRVGEDRGGFDEVDQVAQARAEDDADSRGFGQDRADGGGGFGDEFEER